MPTIIKDKLKVEICCDEKEVGTAASDFVVSHLQEAIEDRGHANLILATGASQFAFIEAFQKRNLDWNKIRVFHLDEYIGLTEQHPASFRRFLKNRILDNVQPKEVFLINGDAKNIKDEINTYESVLKKHSIDVACIGIGENGHIAFNDPPVADFNDPHWVKKVALDKDCRMQQVNEGWFSTLGDVPAEAISLTIPAIMSSRVISCVVPEQRKAPAVNHTLNGPVTTDCPATILRTHPEAVLFLDRFSGAKFL